MTIEEFPGNSKHVKEKKIRKVISGNAIRQEKSLTQKIANTFLGDDTRSVGQYILFDVLIPAAKNTIQEMISTGLEMLLFGETSGRGRGGRSRRERDGRSVVSYGSFYKKDEEPRYRSVGSRDRFNLDEIVFRKGNEAAEVLAQLCDLLEEYEQVSVNDYFELAGIEGATWAHQRWGWDDLSKAHCTPTRGGYTIIFPRVIELD
jgi:hypothetical protein